MRNTIKKIASLLALTIGALSLSASTVYLTEDYNEDKVSVHQGVVLEQEESISQLKGFRKKGAKEVYATKNLSLELAVVNSESIVKVINDGDVQEVLLTLNISNDILVEDYYEAWEAKEELFLEKCSQCHASPEIGHHTMLEWEGLYGSMKGFAQPTPEEEIIILRYLKTFASDGIIKEEE